ncbi:MAG: thioesterase family protein [Nocardia sp.]|uniref:acyl-CoA thioesterase domain-containing protein n=1 Tax=Nocardia sp. TaxID=1821 RepID=UPI00261EFDD3|nr:acyl-CoA thioesterase domain-containing protein [Nocardia sp.]MCU1647866.1 thioesterase family protein [Nocardia sp.]
MVAFFNMVDGCYVATDLAASPWAPSQVSGTALCGLLAREAETRSPGAAFIPGRFTVDLFRPVLAEPIQLRSEVVRDGTRVRVVDVSIVQHDQVRARATLMYLAVAERSPGQVWQPVRQLPAPERTAEWNPLLFKSGSQNWTGDFGSGQNDERKCVWHDVLPLVEGEPNSPFQLAAYVADTTSMVCNWGTEGIGYINCDVTVTLSRLPEGPEVGLQALEQVSADGVAIAAATMYDRTGPLGVSVATGVSNVRRRVDPAVFAAELSSSAAQPQ